MIYDQKGNVEYVNPSFTRVFGWARDELQGKRLDYTPEDKKAERSQARRRMNLGEKVQGFETQRKTKTGEILDVEASLSLFKDREGNEAGSIVILRDVTEKRKMESLRNAKESAEAANLAKVEYIEKQSGKPESVAEPTRVRFEPASVLVADDVKTNRDLIKEFLKEFDIKIIEAENGKQAVNLAAELKPELILMDMKMPEMDGYEATELLKKK